MTGLALVHDSTWGGDAMPDGVRITPPDYSGTYATRSTAEARAARIRANVAELVTDLVTAWREHDDEALGFATFGEYLEYLFGDVRRVSIPVEARRELVAGMTERDDLSVRKIAEQLGVSKSIVALDRKVMLADEELIEARVLDVEPADGPVVIDVEPEPEVAMSKRDRAVQLVRERGGLTSLELAELTGWRYGQASGTLADVKRQRRVRALAEFRDGYAVHVADD
jgi:hypothetical protein